jgi:hypothetical protein
MIYLLPLLPSLLDFVDMSHASALSRQDTLPADDSSWSYSPVQGQPAPIPPRNEPLLFISNHTVTVHANACSKNLPLPAAISEDNPRIETPMASSTHTTNPDHSDSHAGNPNHVCSPLI